MESHKLSFYLTFESIGAERKMIRYSSYQTEFNYHLINGVSDGPNVIEYVCL